MSNTTTIGFDCWDGSLGSVQDANGRTLRFASLVEAQSFARGLAHAEAEKAREQCSFAGRTRFYVLDASGARSGETCEVQS